MHRAKTFPCALRENLSTGFLKKGVSNQSPQLSRLGTFEILLFIKVFKIWASLRNNLSPRGWEQHRCRQACTSAQSDQRLCYSLCGKYHYVNFLQVKFLFSTQSM